MMINVEDIFETVDNPTTAFPPGRYEVYKIYRLEGRLKVVVRDIDDDPTSRQPTKYEVDGPQFLKVFKSQPYCTAPMKAAIIEREAA